MEEVWHCVIIEKGSLRDIDGEVEQGVSTLKKGDIII